MKCKVFNIRLCEEYTQKDTDVLNSFLSEESPKRIFASVSERDEFWSVLIFYEERQLQIENKTKSKRDDKHEEEVVLSSDEAFDYEDLRTWRNRRAKQEKLAPFMVAHDSWLRQMVKMPVKKREDFLLIKGFGEGRIVKYADEILAILEIPTESRRVTSI